MLWGHLREGGKRASSAGPGGVREPDAGAGGPGGEGTGRGRAGGGRGSGSGSLGRSLVLFCRLQDPRPFIPPPLESGGGGHAATHQV